MSIEILADLGGGMGEEICCCICCIAARSGSMVSSGRSGSPGSIGSVLEGESFRGLSLEKVNKHCFNFVTKLNNYLKLKSSNNCYKFSYFQILYSTKLQFINRILEKNCVFLQSFYGMSK